VAAYLVTILLYNCNDDASDDDTARWYIRWFEGEEESRAMTTGGGSGLMSRWLRNKGSVLCHQAAAKVIIQTTWGKITLPPLAKVHSDLPCTCGVCGHADRWEGRAVFCSENYRFSREFEWFTWEMRIRNYMLLAIDFL
jgi:hypothetical protein